ncbi:hypothetical protein [Cupriavidus basilensis]|uniref:hypothetical protein n=1 Tax=Cupriavidus basilensis TaxID=68895 RepID=UPI0020A64849|nr:hypothetical protein [Cupriavidus basilensis]MCP3024202.1 hypothetical protein [Cupriavidus basilensis]MDR3384388.1 hypothetical protein [Cupriavidus basilensis]
MAAPAGAADDPIKPAEQLLFMADHLKTVRVPADLVYRFDKGGSLVPAGSDEVHVRLSRGGTGVSAVVSDASGTMPFAGEAPLRGNPVILYFLEKDIAEMRQLTGGQPRYFQKRIRLALAQGPAITPVTAELDGKPVPARQIVIQPYLDDPNHARFENLVGKRYTFVLSDRVPGQVLLLKSEVPGKVSGETPDQARDFARPVQTETLRFRGTKP